MKKHYMKLTAVITSLIFAAFALAGLFFASVNATKISEENAKHIEGEVYSNAYNNSETATLNDLIDYTYYKSWRHMAASTPERPYAGYYSCIEHYDNEGNVRKLGLDNFILVFAYDNVHDTEVREVRYMSVEDGFKYDPHILNRIIDFSFDGMVDDVFLYDGTVSGKYEYGKNEMSSAVGRNEFVCDEKAVPFSEWQKGKELECWYFHMADDKARERLNDEAEEKYLELKDEPEIPSGPQGDFFTSYIKYVLFYELDDGTYADVTYVFVYHPMMMAIRYNILSYILGAVMLAAVEIFVVIMMKKLYSNRMSYELMRQDLTRGIAHDLKTPLAIVKAYTENWEYIDDKDRTEYAEKLNAEVDNMAAMINNMLNMSKLDQSEEDLELEEVDLYRIAESIYGQMKPIIDEKGLDVKLVRDVEDGEYLVMADPKMIRIAMSNFVTNAVKYARSKVTVKLLCNEKKVIFMVCNDGMRIDKKELKRIWEPFYKTDKSRNDRIGSSGMGLAINRSILKLHHAKYRCSSDFTETSFSFELKRVK